MKLLVADPLEKKGLKLLERQKDIQVDVKLGLTSAELKQVIKNYDAVIVRSGTQLTRDILRAAKKLKVIGRAGVGVDNVDLEEATRLGILVMNTPEGNTVSTAEHTLSMILSMARKIPQAHASLRRNEWKRKAFLGMELAGKTLGIIGFGRIGREVAKRAAAFGMAILVYDPFISKEQAKRLDVSGASLKAVLKRSDIITLHLPLTKDTHHLLNEAAFKQMKRGVRIVNCARGGIVDERALCEAIQSGIVKGAALDVFEHEPPNGNPLLTFEEVVAVPHLGANTEEAQENVSLAVAEQVLDALRNKEIKNAVNMPSLDAETRKFLKPWLRLAERMANFSTQLFGGGVQRVEITASGEVAQRNLTVVTLAALKGLLAPICGPEVNEVNARAVATERGMEVKESTVSRLGAFTNALSVATVSERGTNLIVGTLFENQTPRLVRVNEFYVDAHPEGIMLVLRNEDKPGFVGEIGTLLGKHKINIAEMNLGRTKAGQSAFTVINTDQDIPAPVLEEIRRLEKVIDARVVRL